MKPDENLYKVFLEHMNDLENFRMAYAARHPSIPLEREDPDVRRLTEAMAYFAARTHVAGLRNITDFRRRIFRQFFAFLLTPMPAMGMLRANLSGQFGEPVLLPADSQIAVTSETKGSAFFRTLQPVRILPIRIQGLKMALLPEKGFRILLKITAAYPRNDDVGRLRFYINHLNDYQASLRILYALRVHLRRTAVVFDRDVTDDRGQSCDVSFGAPRDPETEYWPHPLQKERSFFHFPQQDLFMNVRVPSGPRNWSRFTICFDLDSNWPRSLTLNEEVFQLFAVPITNLNRTMSQPIICDGTRERYPVRHPEPEYNFDLHSVGGVYRTDDGVMKPMRPGILSGGSGSYEIEESNGHTESRRQWLVLHFPEAFLQPQTISVDAFWSQPWFSQTLRDRLTVTTFSRKIGGIKWDLVDDIVPQTENAFQHEPEGFMHLLTLRRKSTLNMDDVLVLLNSLGSVRESQFKRPYDLLKEIKAEEVPLGKAGQNGLLKLVYQLKFDIFDSSLKPLVETFGDHLNQILDSWISETAVEIRM